MTTIQIKGAVVIRGHGADYVVLKTTLPSGLWPFKGEASVKFEVAAGSAEQYCKDHLPDLQDLEVIDTRAGGKTHET